MSPGIVWRGIPAHRPRADNVAHRHDLMESNGWLGVAVEGAPARGHAAEHGAAIGLEAADQLAAFVHRVFRAIFEPDSPDGHERLAAQVQGGGVGAYFHACAEMPPVFEHHAEFAGRDAAQVVHHGVDAAMLECGVAAVAEQLRAV